MSDGAGEECVTSKVQVSGSVSGPYGTPAGKGSREAREGTDTPLEVRVLYRWVSGGLSSTGRYGTLVFRGV